MKGKSSFVFYCDWKNTFDQLDNEHSGRLIKHILSYVNDENPECDDLVVNVAFASIQNTLKRDLAKYQKRCEVNKENARKGGIAKSKKRKVPNGIIRNKIVPDSDNDSDSDTDSVNDISFRKDMFMDELRSYLSKYSKEMLRDFYDYWTEHKPNGKKMRFEMQKTWDTSKRLERWSRNSFGKKSKSNIENILTDLMNE